ncbi:MAG TPA: alpha/beta fold hydrolase [Caulobacteraceae bacterium]
MLNAHFAALVVASTLALAGPVHAAGPPPNNRAEAVEVVRGLRRIVTPHGIDIAETVRIGGIDQWITIRGDDRRNPVLLVLHGGPGYVEMPLSWWYARGWEEYFTVVQWDQRGAGKTYLINDPKAVAPTMTEGRMLADTEEMAAWLRNSLGKRRIFVWGHSWGSYLGLELARRHPDWLHAYIGTGQVANSPKSERRGWAFALTAARRAGNARAVSELQAIAPYAAPGRRIALKDAMVVHKWGDYFGGVMAYRTSQEDESHAGRLSPDYSDAEAPHIYDGNAFSEHYLLADVFNLDLSGETRLATPLILLEGRHDRTVSSDVAHEWFEKVTAPEKRFVWFENSAHEPESEEPGKFLLSLVRYARPIAAKAGDVAP